jgi:hypothetical protein
MANHVWTNVIVESDKIDVHDKIDEWFIDIKSWRDDAVRLTVEPLFGEYEDFPIDEIGSKWVHVEDLYVGTAETEITFTSAWDFPEGYMKKFVEKMVEIGDDVIVTFRGDEESNCFIFGGYANKKGFSWLEENPPDRPLEDECAADGLNYEDELEKFYGEVGDMQDELVISATIEVNGEL